VFNKKHWQKMTWQSWGRNRPICCLLSPAHCCLLPAGCSIVLYTEAPCFSYTGMTPNSVTEFFLLFHSNQRLQWLFVLDRSWCDTISFTVKS
jgi:hypothetical protein